MDIPITTILFYSALYDVVHNKIPNYCVLAILLIGISQTVLNVFGLGFISNLSLADAILGLLVGFMTCIFLHIKGLFGAGDAKLLASLGIIYGPVDIFLLIAFSIAFSGLLSASRLACYGELYPMLSRWYDSFRLGFYLKPESNTVAAGAVPMGGAILLATAYCEFYLF
ncbi:prepilin peptidase [Photobacterium lutimaris]|uniref:Prepilin peptidase n=1 Tax=Photobacterium lutimaris TaxID=388278 RepID=A0A2T3J3Y1_9GAMM|nr:A24 family peptidase [Photobacterium lutimaris]PSU35999.1 prepilin peptidase [Photobacterium lutimaris]TDR79090.1 prepilin peptidase CpaA [Photobacterium lutimaris]